MAWDWERVRPARRVWRLAEHIIDREVRRETPRTATGTVALPAKKMFQNALIHLDFLGVYQAPDNHSSDQRAHGRKKGWAEK